MKTIYYYIILFLLLVSACSEKELKPISGSNGKPGVVTEVNVENIPGGAILTYKIPESEDLLSIKAVYKLSNGKTYEASASYYDNKLTVEGFNDTESHEVTLYAINRAQEMSDPVVVTINPQESPLSKIAKSMEIVTDFGGARFIWSNKDNAPITIDLMAQDSTGALKVIRVVYSEATEAYQSLRGYQPEDWKFGAVVRDFWENASDTIYPEGGSLVPLFEEELDKTKMNVMNLTNDASLKNWEGQDFYIIDDDLTTFGHTANSSVPAPFTIDLGCTVKLSRFKNWQRNYSSSYYNWGNPSRYTVYGRLEKPSPSGDWDEWTKIMECTVVKPSGSPSGTVTDEDKVAAEEGHEFTFDLDQPPIRYIRFVVEETFGNTSFSHPCEFSFWGEVINE